MMNAGHNKKRILKHALSAALPIFTMMACSGSSKSTTKEAWNSENDPINISADFNLALASLPAEGTLDITPWSDTYWPSAAGGISNRWHSTTTTDQFGYASPTLDQLKAMTAAQIADLSPAEKYDIYVGHYDYPTVASERQRTSPKNAGWEGICHGWAPAALNFTKPHAVSLTNSDGVTILFGEADVKALLDYYQGQASDAPSKMLGMRCDVDVSKFKNPADVIKVHPECKGINPGSFHVALANLIGLQKKGFVIDASHGDQIWNQPVYSYKTTVVKTQVPSAGAATDAVSETVFRTELTYTQEIDAVWSSDDASLNTNTYNYRVEVDASGNIVGGAWEADPGSDFLWTQETPAFSGYYQNVQQIYNAAITGSAVDDPTPSAE